MMNAPVKFDRELEDFHADAVFLDIHLHGQDLYPVFMQTLSRCFPFKYLFPLLAPLTRLHSGRVNGGVLCAVGDRPFERPRNGGAFLASVAAQLKTLEKDVKQSRGCMVHDSNDLQQSLKSGRLVFIPGLEGLNSAFDVIADLEALRNMGFRIITPVHLVNNRIGTTTASYLQYWRKQPRHSGSRGLTPFGEQFIRKMDDLGLLIDLAHADENTFNDIAGLARHPLMVSHSGACAVHPFHRYLSDDQIHQIRDSGGVIGLWPMYYLRTGMKDSHSFKSHVRHLLDHAGEDHIAIGTDMHGIPGFMEGYSGPEDSLFLTQLLFETGLNEHQVRKILGLNFIRVLGKW